jgi:UPF0755 protein
MSTAGARKRDPFAEPDRRHSRWRWAGRLALLFATVACCASAALLTFGQLPIGDGEMPGPPGGPDPDLGLPDRIALQFYLMSRRDRLAQPAGPGGEPRRFDIRPGQSAAEIAAGLADEGLLADPELFVNYLRYYGLDSTLTAGSYQLDPDATIPELAQTLGRLDAQMVELVFLEGWRIGEMADYLALVRPAQIDAGQFQSLGEEGWAGLAQEYAFLGSLAVGDGLEGFLFPDTYRISVGAEAEDLIRMMLTNFDRRVTPATRQAFGTQGLSVREAVTLASIVEREAVVASERPLIAGVYLNRLAQGMLLQADPTVQYALGRQAPSGSWWKSPLSAEDLGADSPYNTYVSPGLPPGPIANPGLASLEAVAHPQASDYLFFVADCTAETPGVHVFSRTFEEHLANVSRCH